MTRKVSRSGTVKYSSAYAQNSIESAYKYHQNLLVNSQIVCLNSDSSSILDYAVNRAKDNLNATLTQLVCAIPAVFGTFNCTSVVKYQGHSLGYIRSHLEVVGNLSTSNEILSMVNQTVATCESYVKPGQDNGDTALAVLAVTGTGLLLCTVGMFGIYRKYLATPEPVINANIHENAIPLMRQA